MRTWLLEHIRCRDCAGALRVAFACEGEGDELRYGVVACAGCAQQFPVVEGIPLLIPPDGRLDVRCETTDEVVLRGARIGDVIAAIERRDATGALAMLLNPTSLDGASWTFDPARTGVRRVFRGEVTVEPGSEARPASFGAALRACVRRPYRGIRRLYRKRMLPRWRRRMAEFLRANRHRLSAKALFELFYDEYSGACGMADYFVYRFGQPRHLAALSACSLIRGRPGVTLDLACGAGHLTHFLTYGLAQPRVIGLDREFIRLFIAKHYMAPQAEFVCMAADGTLPFPDRALSSVLCSDAFHYFPRKAVTARELGRVLDEAGVMILTRMANAHHEPHEGYELDPDGYRGLFPGWCTALAGEGELVDGYLAGRKPQLAASRPTSAVEQEKWLTLFASRSTGLLRDHGTFDDVPHAVGRLGVNPIYVEAPTADGGRRLSFEFPSPWYAFEDGRYRQYAVPSALVSRKVAESVARGIRSPEQDRHIASFALVGMPDLYREPAGASRSGAG